MTRRIIPLASALLLLCGCSGTAAIVKRPSSPPVAVTSPPAATAPSAAPATPTTPGSPTAASPPATAPASPAAAGSPAPRPGAAPATGPLRPELSAEEEQRLLETARQNIGDVARLLSDLEGRALKPPQQEAIRTAKNFLDQARSALGQRDYQRAANLASKARALTDDLAGTTK